MKKAILVVSFGTSYPETRKKTIEACENKIRKTFDEYDVFRAFTSNMIIKKLANRDKIYIDNPVESLQKLYEKGYKEVIVQTLHIINGEEFDKLKNQVRSFECKFEKLSLGKPLLTTIDDYKKTTNALKLQVPTLKENEAVVLMGHGTFHEAHSSYTCLNYMLEEANINAYVGTVEGYPELENVITRLRKNNISKAILMPFMLVAGDHAINDMASDEEDSWKSILEKEGFDVEVYLKGLGENSKIQDIFVSHINDLIKEEGI